MPATYRDTSARIKLGPVTSYRDTAARIKVTIPQFRWRDTAGRIRLRLNPITVQFSSLSGLDPIYASPSSGGDAFANDGRVKLWVINAGGTTRTLRFKAQRVCDQGILHDQISTIDPGKRLEFGPFNTARFNDQVTQMVQVIYDNTLGLQVAAISPP